MPRFTALQKQVLIMARENGVTAKELRERLPEIQARHQKLLAQNNARGFKSAVISAGSLVLSQLRKRGFLQTKMPASDGYMRNNSTVFYLTGKARKLDEIIVAGVMES